MVARIDPRVEKAVRKAMGHAARVEEDELDSVLAGLDDAQRLEAASLGMTVAGYVIITAGEGKWPNDATVRHIAGDLATTGETARRLRLDAAEVYAYLARAALGLEPLEDVIPDGKQATRLTVIVAVLALTLYGPEGKEWWEYLDQIEAAIEIAWALDASVLPAAVFRAHLPKAESLRKGFTPGQLRIHAEHPFGKLGRSHRVDPHHRQAGLRGPRGSRT
jgi:hypothetical protein